MRRYGIRLILIFDCLGKKHKKVRKYGRRSTETEKMRILGKRK